MQLINFYLTFTFLSLIWIHFLIQLLYSTISDYWPPQYTRSQFINPTIHSLMSATHLKKNKWAVIKNNLKSN